MARAHGTPKLLRAGGPLRARLAEAVAALDAAYAILGAEDGSRVDSVSAEEWLLDNRYIVQEQIREIEDDLPQGYLRTLPRIATGKSAKYPRVYAACVDYLLHTGARLDPDTLAAYVDGYQTVAPLTIGELWAVPIMLRLGLLVVLGRTAREVTTDTSRARAAVVTRELVAHGDRASEILRSLEGGEIDASLLVQMWTLLREHEASSSTIQWIRDRAAMLGAPPEELAHRMHLRQAAGQLTVANAIASMRTINTYEWRRFFERTSIVERILSRDARGTYGATDVECRDRYRKAVERVALWSGADEPTVAEKAIELARGHAEGARSCVGYYLEPGGRGELERACGARPPTRERIARAITGHPMAFYFVSTLGLTAAIGGLAWRAVRGTSGDGPASVVTALLVFAASEIALSTVGALVVTLLPPRLLSRLALDHGLTPAHRTLVAVPALFDSVETVDRLLAELEVRALANPDPDLHFALLSDFCDAEREREDADAALLERATSGIAALNARHAVASGLPRYALFHRRRVENRAQGCFMGWERKRGKLEELNRLILRRGPTTFVVVTAPPELVSTVQYVITLDADTDLPRTAATRLVATIAHPLNRPKLSADGRRVVEGYGVIQPRVGTVPSSARRSRFARISAGPAGLDPYTTAVSDVYQDLFGEGSYIGKAIYDVRAFAAVHDGRSPDNRLLSHDLFEGVLARTALASDIELLDEQPASYGVVARRAHRWIRGDWQLLSLLGRSTKAPPAPGAGEGLGALGLWKIFDNLRRSLLGPSSVLALLLALLFWPAAAVRVAAVLGLVMVSPIVLRLLASALRRERSRSTHGSLWLDSRTTIFHAILGIVLLFDQALVSADAILRTLHRLLVSKRNLLEWQSTGLDANGAKTPRRMWLEVPVLAIVLAMVAWRGGALGVAVPVLACWMLAPLVVEWLGRPLRAVDGAATLDDAHRRTLRRVARKTWHFFETFVGEEDHWLPPDNFQEEPRPVVAHRTSPTNIGLYLMSVVAARDMGYIVWREAIRRLTDTLDTLDRLEKRDGHILNWYDTKSLRPLEPLYVSTVDSGNLAAYLWTVHQACDEWVDAPFVGPEALIAIADAVLVAGKAEPTPPPSEDIDGILDGLERAVEGDTNDGWLRRAEETRTRWRDEIAHVAPHRVWMRQVPESLAGVEAFLSLQKELRDARSLRALAELPGRTREMRAALAALETDAAARAWLGELWARVDQAATACAELCAALRSVAERTWALATGMSFGFLYDVDRSLFAIGYNVSTARLDGSRYDLLASEARLASFIAIAKGDIPEKHWFHLGRAQSRVGSERVLLSWSGSMFEFLMPLLVLRSFPDSLLQETHLAAVHAQRAYGQKHGVPWGISEAAFNVMDLSMTYQYRAFGTPGLGLKPGLEDDLVVAPYATALAAMMDADAAVQNLGALMREGLDGRYGFYDSIDYTPSRVPPNRRGVVVKTFMAHHQGMSLVALTNVLLGAPMQRRFHAIPRVKATELLLQERVPSSAPLVEERASRGPAPSPVSEDLSLVEVVGLEPQGLARQHLLGHGELATTVSSIGTGALTWRGLDIVRARGDQRVAPQGTFVYLQDAATGQVWSAGLEPTRAQPAAYSASFTVDHVELHRRDGDVETTTEIVASPEHAVEIRRITLKNHSDRAAEIVVTTYAEIVLAPRAADVAHPAFSNMFVDVEHDEALGALLATRRPQPGETLQPWVVQTLLPEGTGWSSLHVESSRARFLGRGRDTARPRGLEVKLAGATRHPLDPAFVLRRVVTLPPKGTARVSLVTGIAASREEVVALARAYSGPAPIARAFELAWADARVELKHLGVSAAQSFRFQRLLSFLLDPHPSLRVGPAEAHGDGRAALWSLGISGDLPILVVRADDAEVSDLCREVLLAHEFFRLNNFSVDLLLLNEEPGSYHQPRQDELQSLVQSSFGQGHVDQRGGVFVRRASAMDEQEHRHVLAAARVVLRTSAGSLARQIRVAVVEPEAVAPLPPPPMTERPASPPLLFDNGIGGFTRDGKEYVVYGHTPSPWSNVLANPDFGSLVTERGGGFTWSINSQRWRLTPWSNDAVSDPAGEAIYLATESGDVWKATEGTARHGAGATTFEGTTCGLHHTLTVSVPPDAPVKVSKLVLANETDASIRVRVCGYVEWVLGSTRESSRWTTNATWDAALGAVFAQNAASPQPERCCFFRACGAVARATCDRAEFFGDFTTRARPAGVVRPSTSGTAAVDPCAALVLDVLVPPGESVVVAFVLGDARDRTQARELAAQWRDPTRIDGAIEAARTFWDQTLGTIQVETPDPALDLMLNRWLLHQVLACRMWGRSAFYQSGGAFGFRDQLQDALALLVTRPDLSREHLLRAAARQFEEGDVQHWWHPEDGAGIRTRCSDDMLWLAFAALEYVRVTGDRSVLDEEVPFLHDRPIPAGQRDLFATPAASSTKATLYEHCARAIDVGITAGPHGLPLMKAGDWNDGMDRVGVGGKGESVWLAWFLVAIARDFQALAASRDDHERTARLAATVGRLLGAVDAHAWDGQWYRRAYFDDGAPLGSQTSPECRIDAIAQSWAVLAGGGDAARARRAVDAAEEQLVRSAPPMMLLLTPPFEGKGPDPGYIQAYPPGIRENGGQYTHGVLWLVQALAMLGESDRAYALLSKLNPVRHATGGEGAHRYALEPYVLAGDVYSSPEHDGRGGWSWYTGAAGWMYRIGVQCILGIQIEGSRLMIRPHAPSSWDRYTVRLRRGTASYTIVVEPGERLSIEVDGVVVADGVVQLVDDGRSHSVLARPRRADPVDRRERRHVSTP